VERARQETADRRNDRLRWPAVALDVIAVLAFAIIGRSSHAEATDLTGVLHTAWPFLVGCLLGLALSRFWRAPVSLRTGVVVWLTTVVAGLLLRVAGGSTAQLPFVIVTTVVLGVLLVGWRAGYLVVRRTRP
jgi:peptidoglycan/LPS O-acetylase OafA/YrhL